MRRKDEIAYYLAECKVFSAMLGGHINNREYHDRLKALRLIYGVTT